MKIIYLAYIRVPTEKAHGIQIMKTCEAFKKVGIEIELFVPGRKTHIREDTFSYYGVKEKFTLTTLKVPDLVWMGTIGFIISLTWFAEVAKWQNKFWKADVVYSRDASILLQYVLLERKLVYEAHTKPTFISTFVAKRAYKLVVISEGLRDAYIKRGIRPEKIVVAHDAVDVEAFQKTYDQKVEREKLGISINKKVALYVGRIDSSKGADTFAASSEHLPEDWICVLVGDGPIKKQLEKKYPKTYFISQTPYKELPRVLSSGDVLVLPNSGGDENASLYTSPLKAFAYLATHKPIVASNVPALKNILLENATYFDTNSPESCANAITSFSKRDNQSDLLNLSWANRADTILKHLFHDTH